jgi:hypothetical protein
MREKCDADMTREYAVMEEHNTKSTGRDPRCGYIYIYNIHVYNIYIYVCIYVYNIHVYDKKHDNDLKYINKMIDHCQKNNLKLIYI